MRWKYRITALTGLMLSAGFIVAMASSSAVAAQGRVTVRVEGQGRTVISRRSVPIHQGWVVKGGHGHGLCPLDSAQGALAEATHGRWSGIWYASYDEWEITRIRGVRPRNSSHWWEMFVNGRPAQVGACEQSLTPGDHVLFALVSGNGEDALGVRTPATVRHGTTFRVRVFYSDGAGHHHPLRGATVTFGGERGKTGRHGYVRLHAGAAGVKELRAYYRGYVRTETRLRVH